MSLAGSLQRNLPATRSPEFRRLWLAGTASSIALWTLFLGNAWIVFELSDSSAWVGVATFASFFPFLIAPIGGVVADRIERRRLLLATRFAALAVTVVLFALALADVLTVWLVVALAFGQGLVRSAETPADQALLANVVPREDIGSAVTLSTTTRLGSRAVGPLLAGPLLATIGVEGAYAVAVLFGIAATVPIARMRVVSRGGVEDIGHALASLVEGVRYVRASPMLSAIFLLVVAHCTLTMSFDAMLPAFADNELDRPTNGLTVLVVAIGSGAFAGTLVLSLLQNVRRGGIFLVTAITSGLAPVLLAYSGVLPLAALAAVLTGATQAMFMALAAVFIQEVVDDALRGRVMSLYLMSAGGIMAFSNLGFGALSDFTGVPIVLTVAGLAFVAITLATFAGRRTLRRLYDGSLLPPGEFAAP